MPAGGRRARPSAVTHDRYCERHACRRQARTAIGRDSQSLLRASNLPAAGLHGHRPCLTIATASVQPASGRPARPSTVTHDRYCGRPACLRQTCAAIGRDPQSLQRASSLPAAGVHGQRPFLTIATASDMPSGHRLARPSAVTHNRYCERPACQRQACTAIGRDSRSLLRATGLTEAGAHGRRP